jgi:hypothetical protein
VSAQLVHDRIPGAAVVVVTGGTQVVTVAAIGSLSAAFSYDLVG